MAWKSIAAPIVAACALLAACGSPSAPDITPATVVLSPATALSITSGAKTTLTATVANKEGAALTGQTISWGSSNTAAATVLGGVVTGNKVGQTTITATVSVTSGSTVTNITSTGVVVTVTPGTPSSMVVKTQPAGASVGVPFVTQPVVQILDSAGNLATQVTAPVTVSVTSGSGTLSGTTSVVPSGGLATFTNLALNGTTGDYSLGFTTTGLSSVFSTITLGAGPATQLAIRSAPTSVLSAPRVMPTFTVEVRDASANLAATSTASVTASIASGTDTLSGTTTVAAVAGVATFSNLTMSGSGSGTIAFTSATLTGATTGTITLIPALVSTYGTATTKVAIVDVGKTTSPAVSTATVSGSAATDTSLKFVVRSPSVASVSSSGVITATGAGETWVAQTSTLGVGDSVFVIVPQSTTAPILRTDLTTYNWKKGDVVTVNVILDTRSTTKLGALTGVLSWSNDATTGVLSLVKVDSTGATIVPTTSADSLVGLVRFSLASNTGAAGVVQVMKVTFTAKASGSGYIVLNATEVVAIDLTTMTPVTLTQFPVVIK